MTIPAKQVPATAREAALAELRSLGFDNQQSDELRRLIVSISGKEGTAKTHFLLTAPEPIFLFNIDIGTEGVVEKFRVAGRDIYIYDIRVPKGAKQDVYQTMWREFRERVDKVYKFNEGTLGVDTGTEGYELARLAYLGKLTQVLPHHYVEVKAVWREILRQGYDSRMNTVFINKVKPKYVNDKRTGEYEVAGFDEMAYMVQVDLTTFKELDDEGGLKFGYTINKCRRQPSLCGAEYRTIVPITNREELQVDPVVNFDFLLNLVHGPKKE